MGRCSALDRHGLRTVQPAWPSCRAHLGPALYGGAPPEQPLLCRPVPTVDPRYGTGRSWFDAIAQRRLAQLPGIMRQNTFASIAWEQPDAERRLQQTDLLSDGRGDHAKLSRRSTDRTLWSSCLEALDGLDIDVNCDARTLRETASAVRSLPGQPNYHLLII